MNELHERGMCGTSCLFCNLEADNRKQAQSGADKTSREIIDEVFDEYKEAWERLAEL